MLSLQHILISFLQHDCKINNLLKDLKYILLPDAIRFYTENRQFSHFERTPDNLDVSWIKFPIDLKNLNKEIIDKTNKYLSYKILPCAIGEETDITAFEISNKNLPEDYFYGIKKHLIQDQEYDIFIRKIIDCKDRYNNNFYYKENLLDAIAVRKIITDIEYYGILVLSKLIYEKTDGQIITDQKWFDENIKQYLYDEYCFELAENTYKYINIPKEFNDIISNANWNLLNNYKDFNYEDYIELYNIILRRINNECLKEIYKENALENINNSLISLAKIFDEKIKFDEYKNSLFDNMHTELMNYKNNASNKNVEMMALDIIQLLDIYQKIVNKAKSNSNFNEETFKKLLNNFDGILQDLLDVLYRQNIEPYEVEEDIIDVKRQKITSTIKTNDESLNNKLAMKNAPGYEINGRILRPERISIYKYEKGEK